MTGGYRAPDSIAAASPIGRQRTASRLPNGDQRKYDETPIGVHFMD
jgi:hypothetical protein